MSRTPCREFRPRDPARARALAGVSLTIASAIALVGGCTTGNDRLHTGPAKGGGQTASLAEFASANAPPTARLNADNKLTSIGRHDWPVTNVVVPVDGVSANPTYATSLTTTSTTVRQRGDFPNALSALDLEGGTTWQQYGEIGYAPLRVATDLVMMVPRMFVNGPGEELPVKPRQMWRAPVVIAREPYAAAPSQ